MHTDEQLSVARHALRIRLKELGYSRAMASEVVSGKRTPSLGMAVQIEKEIGIPPGAWANGPPIKLMWDILAKPVRKSRSDAV